MFGLETFGLPSGRLFDGAIAELGGIPIEVPGPRIGAIGTTDASTGTTDHTISGTLTIGNHANRKVTIPFGWFDATTGVTAATFDGVTMSGLAAIDTATLGSLAGAGILYLDEQYLPVAGTYTWSVTVDGSGGVVLGQAIYIYDVLPGAPEATAGGDNTSTSITTNITALTENTLVVDVLVNQSGADDGTPDLAQTETADFTGGSGVPRLCVSYKYVSADGATSTSWSSLDGSSGHLLVNAVFAKHPGGSGVIAMPMFVGGWL